MNLISIIKQKISGEIYIDMNNFKSSPPISEEERKKRYNKKHVAEMTLNQAGENI